MRPETINLYPIIFVWSSLSWTRRTVILLVVRAILIREAYHRHFVLDPRYPPTNRCQKLLYSRTSLSAKDQRQSITQTVVAEGERGQTLNTSTQLPALCCSSPLLSDTTSCRPRRAELVDPLETMDYRASWPRSYIFLPCDLQDRPRPGHTNLSYLP